MSNPESLGENEIISPSQQHEFIDAFISLKPLLTASLVDPSILVSEGMMTRSFASFISETGWPIDVTIDEFIFEDIEEGNIESSALELRVPAPPESVENGSRMKTVSIYKMSFKKQPSMGREEYTPSFRESVYVQSTEEAENEKMFMEYGIPMGDSLWKEVPPTSISQSLELGRLLDEGEIEAEEANELWAQIYGAERAFEKATGDTSRTFTIERFNTAMHILKSLGTHNLLS